MSHSPIVFWSIPGLRAKDLDSMPQLTRLMQSGEKATLAASFPAVTWPVQANMLTGCPPSEHGVVANGFFWRETNEVEMWTAWNDKIERPQIWDLLHEASPTKSSAVWFPMLSKGCGADAICMPAPIHNPDGSESLWCYTKPIELYGELRDQLGHFPLKHFWGPLAGIPSSQWIADSAAIGMKKFRPDFFYIYIPHLDYAAQKTGPDSPQALQAVRDLDKLLGGLAEQMNQALDGSKPVFVAASEYVITDVNHVSYPNRVLREAGLIRCVTDEGGGEELDVANSSAWALVDHQFSHIFVRNRDESVIRRVVELMRNQAGIDEVLWGESRSRYALDHARSGDVIAISKPESWQAYYWWLDDKAAPAYARTVDIHKKPGYDPVELHFDMPTRSIPLNATLIRGSHGAPPRDPIQKGVLLVSQSGWIGQSGIRDVDVAKLVLRHFGNSQAAVSRNS